MVGRLMNTNKDQTGNTYGDWQAQGTQGNRVGTVFKGEGGGRENGRAGGRQHGVAGGRWKGKVPCGKKEMHKVVVAGSRKVQKGVQGQRVGEGHMGRHTRRIVQAHVSPRPVEPCWGRWGMVLLLYVSRHKMQQEHRGTKPPPAKSFQFKIKIKIKEI